MRQCFLSVARASHSLAGIGMNSIAADSRIQGG